MSTDWRERERMRFETGYYTPVSWASNCWFVNNDDTRDHFLHVSRKNPTMVAFTPSPEYGEQDRQIMMKPGHYLARYFGKVLSAEEIRDLATQFASESEEITVKFATTEDDIEYVYVNGPRSCMAHDADHFSTGNYHPARVYAAGDLAVAYIERDEDKVTARAICWPDKKIYGRIYGDAERLSRALQDLGFVRNDAFDGARLLRVAHKNGFVCPYLDVSPRVRDDGTHLIIDCDGPLDAHNTNGLTGEPYVCDRCGESVECESDLMFVHDADGRWCEDCINDNAEYCTGCELYLCRSQVVNVGIEFYCETCFSRYAFVCGYCEELFMNDCRTVVIMRSADVPACPSCVEERAQACHNCDAMGDSEHGGSTISGDFICYDCTRTLDTAPCGHYLLPTDKEDDECQEHGIPHCTPQEAEAAGQLALAIA